MMIMMRECIVGKSADADRRGVVLVAASVFAKHLISQDVIPGLHLATITRGDS